MTHNEKRQHWLKEGAIGLGTGVLYGVTVSFIEIVKLVPRPRPIPGSASSFMDGKHTKSVKKHTEGFEAIDLYAKSCFVPGFC